MYLSILILPLLMIFIISMFGRYLSHKGIFMLISIMMIELLIISILLNYEVLLNNNIITVNLNINYGILNIN